MSSGIVLNYSVYWVTFHNGYDFGYLLKVLTCRRLPDTQTRFFNFINILQGGFNKLAQLLEVERIGICRKAGSDSLLTSSTSKELIENFFSGSLEKYAGVL
ncbi:putative poly(A)-specific ribonuclease [Helianthus anomalus]